MAKTNQKGRMKHQSFVMLKYCLIDSLAWASLSSHAQALWLYIRRRYNGNNNGTIPLSVGEAAKYLNVSRDTAGKAFRDLQEKGFIKMTKDSSFTLKNQTAREWALTDEICNGQAPTNEWREWKK